jgi:hypothetical protein
LHFTEKRSTMMFRRGQQPYRKRAGLAHDKAKITTARKKARDHAKQEMEKDELPKETDFDEDKDCDNFSGKLSAFYS